MSTTRVNPADVAKALAPFIEPRGMAFHDSTTLDRAVGAVMSVIKASAPTPLSEERIVELAKPWFEPDPNGGCSGRSPLDELLAVEEYKCGEDIVALVRAVECEFGIKEPQ